MADFQRGFGQNGNPGGNLAGPSSAQHDGSEEALEQDMLIYMQWHEEEEKLAKLRKKIHQLEREHAETTKELQCRGIQTGVSDHDVADGAPVASTAGELIEEHLICAAEEARSLEKERFFSAKSAQSPDIPMPLIDRSPLTYECYPGIVYQSIEDPRRYVQPGVAKISPDNNDGRSRKDQGEQRDTAPTYLPSQSNDQAQPKHCIPKSPPYPFTWVQPDGAIYQSTKEPGNDDQAEISDIPMVMGDEPSYQDQLAQRLRLAPLGPPKEYNWIVKPHERAAPRHNMLVFRTEHISGNCPKGKTERGLKKFQKAVEQVHDAISELVAAQAEVQVEHGPAKHTTTPSLLNPKPIYYPQRQRQFDQGDLLESMLKAHKRRNIPASHLYAARVPSRDIPKDLGDDTKSLVAARLVYNRLLWLHDDQRFKSLKVIRMFPGIDQDCTLHDLLMLLQFNDTVPVQIEVNGLSESLLNMSNLVCWRDNDGRFRKVEIRIRDREDASGRLPGFLLEVIMPGRM